MLRISAFVLFCALAGLAGSAITPASAQQPAPPTAAPPQPPYGAPITLDQAKRVMAAAELEAAKNSWIVDDAIAAGGAGMRLLALKDITPLQGGLLILIDGKIAGAIGVSGALSAQDDQIAKAGADVLAKGM